MDVLFVWGLEIIKKKYSDFLNKVSNSIKENLKANPSTKKNSADQNKILR